LSVITGAAFAGPASAEHQFAYAVVASSEYGSSVQDPGLGASAPGVCADQLDPWLPHICGPAGGVNGIQGGNWSAVQATGEFDTYPSCGDIGTAWAPKSSGTNPESLTLFYQPAVANATQVDIYETNLGSFVTQVDLLLQDGSRVTVFSGPDTTPCPGILSIPVSVAQPVAGVRVTTQAPSWEEIDAVSVVN